ncbi:MAG: glycoside hydrolase family 127 protein [Verrucomicrobia bacterium]|nr:glycoside hydrolase family 127 protein [Verrucomicrobiota bacterium]
MGDGFGRVWNLGHARKCGSLHLGNRSPLAPSPMIKLPIGSIKPQGWLRHQLDLEREGMVGRLQELSPWLKFETSAWTNPGGEGERGWEEMPYWLKGYGDLAYVLNDADGIAEARRWIETVMASQREDGWFGPRALLKNLDGKPDLWPHMVMLNVLQSYYEFSRDERSLRCIEAYCGWLQRQPAAVFANGYWPKLRAGDNIETIHWLYNRTGDGALLELAEKIHENMAPWSTGVINWHNVNIAQGFREPAVFFQQSGDRALLERAELNYGTVMDQYGQFPGGGFAGDENCRPGFGDPRQGFETCGMVEFMHSFEMLTKITGDPIWADRCEEIAFNSFPAALTPDWKGLHYLTSANQVQLDAGNKAPAIQNGGTMFAYSPHERYRCCQHNVSHGWPYYAEELWLATHDHGLAASLYADSEVSARVGDGRTVRIVERTEYPFGDRIRFVLEMNEPVAFPLHLRIPGWCGKPELRINGRRVRTEVGAFTFLALNRVWNDGDTVELRLPMKVSVRTWPQNQNAVSVHRGPLAFSLKIGERWVKSGGSDEWPEFEVFPTTPWNYGLELNSRNPAESFTVHRRPGPIAGNPFTLETAPVELEARARRIPAWELDSLGLVGKLQPSPVRSDSGREKITLVPMGAARLRVSLFPVIGRGSDAREWGKAAHRDGSRHLPPSPSGGRAKRLAEPVVWPKPDV